MKTLDTQFDKGGFHFEQIKRSGPWALFRKTRQGVDGFIEGFEVVKIRAKSPTTIKGRYYPERENYPGDNEWGVYGFTYKTEDAAREAFKSKSGIRADGVLA